MTQGCCKLIEPLSLCSGLGAAETRRPMWGAASINTRIPTSMWVACADFRRSVPSILRWGKADFTAKGSRKNFLIFVARFTGNGPNLHIRFCQQAHGPLHV